MLRNIGKGPEPAVKGASFGDTGNVSEFREGRSFVSGLFLRQKVLEAASFSLRWYACPIVGAGKSTSRGNESLSEKLIELACVAIFCLAVFCSSIEAILTDEDGSLTGTPSMFTSKAIGSTEKIASAQVYRPSRTIKALKGLAHYIARLIPTSRMEERSSPALMSRPIICPWFSGE